MASHLLTSLPIWYFELKINLAFFSTVLLRSTELREVLFSPTWPGFLKDLRSKPRAVVLTS